MIRGVKTPAVALGVLVLVACSSAAHSQWAPGGTLLSTATGTVYTTGIESDGQHGAFVTFKRYLYGVANHDVCLQHVTSAGYVSPGWPPQGIVVKAATGVDHNEKYSTPDGTGGIIVVWEQTGGVYAKRILGSGATAPGWSAGGTLVTATSGYLSDVTSDGYGGALISARMNDTTIYVQRVLASGSIASGWPTTGAVFPARGKSSAQAIYPEVVHDGSGGALVTWGASPNTTRNLNIYAQHVMGTGVVDPGWPTDGLTVCSSDSEQVWPSIVRDGAGGAIIAWNDYRNGMSNIYVQHVTGSGVIAAGWPVNGKRLSTVNSYGVTATPDGVGGATLVWGTGSTRVLRITGSGAVSPGWPNDGVEILPGGDDYFEAVPDGSGGVFVSWNHYGDESLVVQHVEGTGSTAPGWASNGVSLSTNGGGPKLALDDSGGVVVAWEDYRSTDIQPYAQRIYSNGTVVAVQTTPIPDELALSSPIPNPSSHGSSMWFSLATGARVSVRVLDAAGREIRTLIQAQILGAGIHSLVWDGRTDSSRETCSGIYFIEVQADNKRLTRRLVIVH